MRTSTRFVGVCVGAPAAALCFGVGTAWAAPSADSSTPHVNTGGVAVSAGGHKVVQVGSSSANTSGRSVAVAFDLPGQNPSTATANGDRSFALAINGSTARADGDRNFVFAGDDSTSTATGNGNDVRAAFGSTNHVTGNDNTSYAIPGSRSAVTGDNNFAASLCGGNVNISGQGQRVTSAPCVGH
ncbi:hypothetical protein VST63_15945 [Mycolicibacterium sp. 050232]|uniref:hypothetical protein n=1 Tax=Mycolicibacterium sp. 050232 TaxID=3113982 RepID=UPI002E28C413|nr:hypothetical protein [Mycolicibacterium sp. 050232]MED5813852.1 hypothetical protein [Mycolicibacterium sp. 050232]